MTTLSIRDIAKRYDGVTALNRVSLDLESGSVHALMGENGAGKSTLVRIISGTDRADSGQICVDGAAMRFSGPLDAQRAGIAIIHQELDLFPNLSVGENMVLGNLRFKEGLFSDQNAIAAFCRPFLEQVLEPGFSSRQLLGELPLAQQQLVAIARALSMECSVILMDEPTSALPADAADRLFKVVGKLKDNGIAIAYVSHKMDEIFRLCDRVTVLRDGNSVGTFDVAAIEAPELIRLMVGRSVDLSARRSSAVTPELLLDVIGLTTHKLRDVSFRLHRGEVVGVAGLVGSGRSELGAALVGLDPILGGRIDLAGRDYRPRNPAGAQSRRVALVPEDRKTQGLMLAMNVRENTSISILPGMSVAGVVNRSRENMRVKSIVEQLSVKCASHDIPVAALSGGNQQKILLARWLLTEPDLLFLDDPARGIDVAAKQDVYSLIRGLAEAGKGVVLASSELPELLRCCDRILVLAEGRLVGVFPSEEATQEILMTAATQGRLA